MKRRGRGTMAHNKIMTQLINLIGGDSLFNNLSDGIKTGGGKGSTGAHGLKILRAVQSDALFVFAHLLPTHISIMLPKTV